MEKTCQVTSADSPFPFDYASPSSGTQSTSFRNPCMCERVRKRGVNWMQMLMNTTQRKGGEPSINQMNKLRSPSERTCRQSFVCARLGKSVEQKVAFSLLCSSILDANLLFGQRLPGERHSDRNKAHFYPWSHYILTNGIGEHFKPRPRESSTSITRILKTVVMNRKGKAACGRGAVEWSNVQ